MHISKNGLRLIEEFEGFVDHQYNDGTGVMTIGYGTTEADVKPLPQHMTQQEAERFLAARLRDKYEPAVNGLGARINQNQFDALVSFVYNLGPGSMAWDVGRYTKAGNYQAAADAILQYDHAGGRRLAGLTRRRQAERALYLRPWVDDSKHYERFQGVYPLGNRKLDERALVEKFDRLNAHPWRNRAQLKPLRRDLAYLRDRLYRVAGGDTPHPAWGLHDRGWRYRQLRKRVPMNIKPATS